MKKKDYTVTVIVVVGLFLLVMMLIVAITPERSTQRSKIGMMVHKPANVAPVPYGGRIHIEVIDQNVAREVAILSAALKENGYVVIHKEEKGKPGRILGVSKMLAPGLYSDRVVGLTENIAPGEALYAMLYRDNGDGVFSVGADVPIKGDEMTMGSGMVRFMAI